MSGTETASGRIQALMDGGLTISDEPNQTDFGMARDDSSR